MDKSISKQFKIKVPGSSGNLGPGFDVLGLALGIYSQFEICQYKHAVGKNGQVKFIAQGDIASEIDGQNNLFTKILDHELKGQINLEELQITTSTDIFLERGLGSSGACIAAAVAASALLKGQNPSKDEILQNCLKYEPHPDNLAASIWGELVLCISKNHSTNKFSATSKSVFQIQRLHWPETWSTIAVIPSRKVATSLARSVLPKHVERADAIFNLQRIALLIEAVCKENGNLLENALEDRLHQPYRAKLIPELEAVQKHVKGLPVWGSVLSGAGSTILVICNRRNKRIVMESLSDFALSQSKKQGLSVMDIAVDQDGLKIITPN